MKQNIHTVPSENGWVVKLAKTEFPLSQHRTKEEAVKTGASLAKSFGVEHVIHGKDGKIQDKDSYGRDPLPPRDTRF